MIPARCLAERSARRRVVSSRASALAHAGDVPVGYVEFPRAILRPPRSLAVKTSTDIRRWTVRPKGGHFAALEQPEVLAREVMEFFGQL
jgi:microsomal epoxide hydrolase